MKIRRIILFFAVFIYLQYSLFSESSLSDTSERPKVALVLGGGGAKGFAEIPVIELIEQMDIPIDIVIGTSFGSIVGGMYCAGYSLPEIYETMAYTDWTPLFSDYEVSPYEAVLGKHSIYNNVLVNNSYLSALIYYAGLIGILFLGYLYLLLIKRIKKES